MTEGIDQYVKCFQLIGITPPIVIMMTLLNIRGQKILDPKRQYEFPSDRGFNEPPFPIEKDRLFLPDILMEDLNQSLPDLLKPAMDTLFQFSGWPGKI